MTRRRKRVVTTWVDEGTAQQLKQLASDSDSTMSAVIRIIVADLDSSPPGVGDRRRPVTLGSELPLDLIDRVDELARSKGITRSELIAAALIAATS